MKNIILQDIDGTLADARHRVHFVKKEKDSGKRDWKSFFAAAKDDRPYEHILELNRVLFLANYEIILITGRPENLREATEKWLKEFGVYYSKLLMRPVNDRRADFESKGELYEQNLTQEQKDNVLCVFEDRLPVCKMWKDKGLHVVVCGEDWLDGDWSK